MKTKALPILIACLVLLFPDLVRAQSAADLFDDTNLHDIWLEMSPDDWAALRANFMDNTYYRCSVIWSGGVAVQNVGMRSRGNSSRSGIKPALKLDFSKYVSGQKFLGLKGVVLRNLVQDTAMVQERLAVKLFERMGLPVSRESYARVYVNGEFWGLYLLVEDYNQDFLTRQFGDSTGYLYEYEWTMPYYFESLGSDPANYADMFKPQTNEKKPEPQPLVDFIQTINKASDATFTKEVSVFLDLTQFVKHLAVDNYVGESDGFLAEVGANNFYLYRFTGTKRFQFLTWDKNATFGTPEYPIWRNVQENVLARRVLAVPEYRKLYLDTLAECARVVGGAGGWLESEALRLYSQIRQSALEDGRKPYANEDFELGVEIVLWVIRDRPAFVTAAIQK